MTLKFGLEINEDTRWIAVLLASENSVDGYHPVSIKSQPESAEPVIFSQPGL